MTALPLRSMLFIPGDSEKKIAKAADCGADAVIFDLEDAVGAANKPVARRLVAEYLKAAPRSERRCQYWVRVNPVDSGMMLADLTAIVGGAPDGIMQPKTDGPDDVRQLSHYLDALEAAQGIEAVSIKILPVATETAAAPFRLGEFADAGLERLFGLTWGAEDLATAIQASTNRDAQGDWAFTFKMARSLCLLAAHAAGVQAIETLHADYKDDDGLRATSRAARSEGFGGRLCIHPAQVAIVNDAFMPSADEVAHARRVLAAFADSGDAGTVGLDGKMLDVPHRKQAEAVVAQATAFGMI